MFLHAFEGLKEIVVQIYAHRKVPLRDAPLRWLRRSRRRGRSGLRDRGSCGSYRKFNFCLRFEMRVPLSNDDFKLVYLRARWTARPRRRRTLRATVLRARTTPRTPIRTPSQRRKILLSYFSAWVSPTVTLQWSRFQDLSEARFLPYQHRFNFVTSKYMQHSFFTSFRCTVSFWSHWFCLWFWKVRLNRLNNC